MRRMDQSHVAGRNPREKRQRPNIAADRILSPRGKRPGCQVACGLAAFLVGVAAVAAEPSPVEPVALVFDAPRACPTRSDFMEEIGWRTRRVVWGELGGRAGRTLFVSVRATDSGFSGRLDLRRADGQTMSRQFEDSACSEVVSALALVAALAIDPRASQSPLAGPPGPAPGVESPSPGPAVTPGPDVPSAKPAERTSQALEASRAASPEAAPGSPEARSGHWHAIADVSVSSLWGLAPEPMIAVIPSIAAQRRTGRWLSLILRVSPTLAETGFLSPATDRSVFRYFALRAEICGHGHLGWQFELGPCVVGDAGLLAVSGNDQVPTAYHPVRPWSAFGLAADLAWGSALMVRTEIGWVLPVIRDDFVFEPDNELLHRTPWAVGSAAVSLGWRFPK